MSKFRKHFKTFLEEKKIWFFRQNNELTNVLKIPVNRTFEAKWKCYKKNRQNNCEECHLFYYLRSATRIMNWTWKEHFSLSINDERPSIVCDFSSFSMATTFHHYDRHKPPIQSPPPPTHLKPNQVLFLSSFTFTVSLSSLSLSLSS